MKIKTADLIGPPLDWATRFAMPVLSDLAFYGGKLWYIDAVDGRSYEWAPSTTGSEVIDIMEREKINVKWDRVTWLAESRWVQDEERSYAYGPTPRIAVCRAFVASKLGAEIEVPEELIP